MITLRNQYLSVLVNEFGAELTSVKAEDDADYIWQADPAYWKRHAPILFPIVGRLKDNQYVYQGKTYQMTQHGFARDQQFQVVDQTETAVTLLLNQNADTLAKYPFNFNLRVHFELHAHELAIRFTVENPSDQLMLFSLGAHPGFNVPFAGAGNFTDYFIRVAPKAKYRKIPLKPPYSDPADPQELDFTKPLSLNHELFKNDALVLDLKGQQTTLMLANTQNDHGVAVSLTKAPYVGIWSPYPKQAPFVCIEPWWGLADPINTTGHLEDKFAINRLSGHQSFEAGYQLSFF